MSPEQISGGQVTDERYGQPATVGNRRSSAPAGNEQSNGAGYDPAGDKPRLPSLDLADPAGPDFSTAAGWLPDSDGQLADHPLLKGLLLELPPKGSAPPPGWLDRWFEATRSILELLYVTDQTGR